MERTNDMEDSILLSVKKMLMIAEEFDHFDTDLIIHINSVFSILCQLGVGPSTGFAITDESQNWSDFIPNEDPRLNMVKTYMYTKVRMIFDPPTSGAVSEAMNNTIKELEFRLNVQVDPGDET